ncbi:MAG: Dabb family protein [Elusimicrobia bacterium]|nr:Dabb family protein [Elusimicrobiota bacterium]
MIEHIVLFKIKPNTTDEQSSRMLRRLLELREKAPGILEVSAGANFSERSRGFTHGFVVRFKDRAALDAYLPHPEHQAVVQECVRPIAEEVLVVDFEKI